MRTKLWNVKYNRRYERGKGYTFECAEWPYKGREADRAVQVAADSKKEAEKKIRKELELDDDVELYVTKANNLIVV